MKKYLWLLALSITSFAILIAYFHRNLTPMTSGVPQSSSKELASTTSGQLVLGARTKVADCQINGALPDKNCTPGAVLPDANKDAVCTPGYSEKVRNVPQVVKDQVFAEYQILAHQPGEYEVDHLISLELGGSNDIANLWPEPALPKPGFHEKDKVENYLHEKVCTDQISLTEAQRIISSNWLEVYNQL